MGNKKNHMVKAHRLGFPPLTNDEYVELLRSIDKFSNGTARRYWRGPGRTSYRRL
jgi:hypothetical protein